MQLDLFDYTGRKLTPIQVKVKQAIPEDGEKVITATESSVVIGTRTDGNYAAREYIHNNTIRYRNSSPAGYTIESIYYFQLLELTTSEHVYNKFKFI